VKEVLVVFHFFEHVWQIFKIWRITAEFEDSFVLSGIFPPRNHYFIGEGLEWISVKHKLIKMFDIYTV